MIMEDGDHTLSSISRDTRLLRLARIADAFANAPMLRWQELKRAERDVQDGDSDVSDDVESNDGSYLDKGSGI